jgi:hypothetical protein
MCRKNKTAGFCLACAGLGMVLAMLLGSSILSAVIALALLASGLVLAGKQ